MQSTQHYRDLLVQEKMRNKSLYVKHIKEIFKQMDTDNSGTLSFQEMSRLLDDKDMKLQAYFDALEVDASDARAFFKLLDADGSGEIAIDEFCEGCLRLKGEAHSFDINCMMYENRRSCQKMDKFMASTHKWLQHISQQMPLSALASPQQSQFLFDDRRISVCSSGDAHL